LNTFDIDESWISIDNELQQTEHVLDLKSAPSLLIADKLSSIIAYLLSFLTVKIIVILISHTNKSILKEARLKLNYEDLKRKQNDYWDDD